MNDRELLKRLVIELRLWEEDQDDGIVLPEIVDYVEAKVFGEQELPTPIPPDIKKRREKGARTTQLSTLKQWWITPRGSERLEDWLQSHPVSYLKKFCKQEVIDIRGQKTRNSICHVIRNAVQGPVKDFGPVFIRRRRRTGE